MKKVLLLMLFLIFSSSVFAQDGQCDIYLYNNIGHTIYYLYVSPSDASDWGPDLLENIGVLMNREHLDVVFDGERFRSTIYDIRIIDEYDQEAFAWDVDLSTVWGLTAKRQNNGELSLEIDYVE